MLNLIAGLDFEFEGTIEHPRSDSERSDSIGVVFQQPRLMPWLSSIDNLLLVTKGDAKSDREFCESKLERVGLKDAAELYPRQLSGGMQRRLSMARAFVIEPEVLLLDEPFISLDLATANRQRELMTELCRETNPIAILVTHDLREAISVSNRILFLSAGPATVLEDYRVKLGGPRSVNDKDVSRLHEELIERHNELDKEHHSEN